MIEIFLYKRFSDDEIQQIKTKKMSDELKNKFLVQQCKLLDLSFFDKYTIDIDIDDNCSLKSQLNKIVYYCQNRAHNHYWYDSEVRHFSATDAFCYKEKYYILSKRGYHVFDSNFNECGFIESKTLKSIKYARRTGNFNDSHVRSPFETIPNIYTTMDKLDVNHVDPLILTSKKQFYKLVSSFGKKEIVIGQKKFNKNAAIHLAVANNDKECVYCKESIKHLFVLKNKKTNQIELKYSTGDELTMENIITLEHLVLNSQGGRMSLNNIVPCCGLCNRLRDNLNLPSIDAMSINKEKEIDEKYL